MKVLPFILLALLCVGCNKCDKPQDHSRHFSARDYKYAPVGFKDGSYWVYRNTSDNTIDTLYQKNYQDQFIVNGPDHPSDCCHHDVADCYMFEYINYILTGKKLSLYFSSVGEVASQLQFYPDIYPTDGAFVGGAGKIHTDSIFVNGKMYPEYILTLPFNKNDSTIIVPNIGFVRIQYRDSFNYELVDYHLIK